MIKLKKSLGQNFLIDDNIINKITEITEIKEKNVLEVGPGSGNLTNKILEKKPNTLIVIEKDDSLANELKNKYDERINVINDDILRIDETQLNKKKLIVFGNLPYNISTEILCKWILNIHEDNFWFECLILMFQKEVADRIIAKFNTKNYGRLSILANWKLNVSKIMDIGPSCFMPKPKIDSSLLFFEPKKNFYRLKDPKILENITRIFFMHRRKMVKKPYNQFFNGREDIALKLGIDLNLRPQNLNFETFYKLAEEYENLRG